MLTPKPLSHAFPCWSSDRILHGNPKFPKCGLEDHRDQVADFLAVVDIKDVIPGVEDGETESPSLCPVCEESRTIRIITDQTYECADCGYWGTAAQYLIEREGYEEGEALIYEIAKRCRLQPPFDD